MLLVLLLAGVIWGTGVPGMPAAALAFGVNPNACGNMSHPKAQKRLAHFSRWMTALL